MASEGEAARWSKTRAKDWYEKQPWLLGCNFIPSSAVNQLEMWQADTFDPPTIDRELGWAADLGCNSMRVFLHDLVWLHDRDGFKSRIDQYLTISSGHGIFTMFVLFDDCWFPPRAGAQPEPVPGVHNSRWAQSPGHEVARDRAQWDRLEAYVADIVGTFGADPRVCVWDVHNEPGNAFLPVASLPRGQARRQALRHFLRHFVRRSPTLPLLRQSVGWVRAADPMQPLTIGVWAPVPRLAKFQLEVSDVISFHQYDDALKLTERIDQLQAAHGRPVLCTEWMARARGSRFESHLPIFKSRHVGCYSWGLVSGKTQTIHGWEDKPGNPEPPVWHHDILQPDGSPHDPDDTAALRRATSP